MKNIVENMVTTIDKRIWFIDENDKVCLRIKRGFRYNFEEVLDAIDKYEDKAETNSQYLILIL